MINQVLTHWSVPNGASGITTVMNFDSETAVADQRAALATFWGQACLNVNAGVKWEIETNGRVLDESTGSLAGTWSDSTQRTGQGDLGGSGVLANATMLLVRWRCPVIIAGRRLQGRTFIPGAVASTSVNGEVAPAVVTALNVAALAFVDSAVGFGVWSRPTGQRPGAFHEANDGEAWREFAVQRMRRG